MMSSNITKRREEVIQPEHDQTGQPVRNLSKVGKHGIRRTSPHDKVTKWLLDNFLMDEEGTKYRPKYSSPVRLERNISCRLAIRKPPPGFIPGQLIEAPSRLDIQRLTPSQSEVSETDSVSSVILATDSEASDQVKLQRDCSGIYYLLDNFGEKLSLLSPNLDQSTIKLIIDYCLSQNLNGPIVFLIENGIFNPDKYDHKDPFIHLVIGFNNKYLLKFLLEGAYVDINAINFEKDPPLITAMMSDDTEAAYIEIIRLLLIHSPDLSLKDCLGMTALQNAVSFLRSPELTELLLKHGADVQQIQELPEPRKQEDMEDMEDFRKIEKLLFDHGWVKPEEKENARSEKEQKTSAQAKMVRVRK